MSPEPASNWGRQHFDDCALMAVADVVGELTGNKPSEDAIIALATATPNSAGSGPIYTLPRDPKSPTAGDGSVRRKNQLPMINDLPVLLSHFGIDSVHTSDSVAASGGLPTGMSALADYLAKGKKVIASLNGETIWNTPGDRTIHDHDLVVTAVDATAGIVHLNDSASPLPQSQVSIGTFEAAWATSNHAMVIAG